MNTKKATGLQLTDTELDEATRRLAFFAPTGGKQYVQELFTFLAEQALASMNPGVWSGVQIHAKLRKLTGTRVEYEELLSGLHQLVLNDEVSCTTEKNVYHSDARFSMSPVKREEALRDVKSQGEKEKRVIDNWKREVSELYPDIKSSELETLEKDLRTYVYRLVSHSSVESLLLYYSGQSELDDLASRLEADSINQVLPKRSKRLKNIRAEVLPSFFQTIDQNRKDFIYGLLQSTFILHMIQLDPHCSALVQTEIIGGTLYTDTNFIFRLLGLHSPEMFFASRALVDLSHKLNYTLVYTPATRNEYLHALGDNLRSLQLAPKLPEDLLEAVVDISDDEDPIVAYYRKMMDTKSTGMKSYVSPDIYYEYFSEVEGLLEPYGISVNDQHCANIRTEEVELSREASRLKSYVDEKRLRSHDQFYHELSPHVAEHDAFHRLLILRLRAGYDAAEFSDVPYWFLTCDSKLPGYDRVRRASEGLRTPFCVLSAQWLQTLRPFEPRLGSDAIVDSMTSPLLRVFSPIPNSIIREVAGRVQLHRGYTPAVGKIAMKRQFLLQFAQTREEEEKEELIENVFLEHAIEMEKLKSEAEARSEQSEKSIEQLSNKVSTLENEIEEVAQEKTQHENILIQHQKELESRYKELQNEQAARIQAEEERDSYTSELETTKSQLEQTKNLLEQTVHKETDTNAQLDRLGIEFAEFKKQQKQSQRNWLAAFIVLSFFLVLAWVYPWISGENWWFVLTGLLTVLYICALIVFRPMSRGRLEKTFAIGFPVLILFSIALPLGQEKLVFNILGIIANICGILALILFVIYADRNPGPQ